MKLGRLPRTYNPAIPCMSALMNLAKPIVLPDSVDYTAKMPDNLGMMLNDRLGDCTCAAYYHFMQTTSFIATGKMITQVDTDVLKLYEGACGYNPNDPSTDIGGIEQDVLTYLHKTGAPTGTKAQTHHKLTAFFEVDFSNQEYVKRAIYEAGGLYIGFNVPSNIMPDSGAIPELWSVVPGSHDLGGHAVILTGYDSIGLNLISWGQKYKMTWAFLEKYNDEAYALCDREFLTATGKTLLGMTIARLESQMKAL